MRRLVLAMLLALTALAPAAALGPACVPSCDVLGVGNSFASPVTAVLGGATVTWYALDIYHTATADSFCFHEDFTPDSPGVVSFRVEGAALLATSRLGADIACPDAVPHPDGSFRLPYRCIFHAPMVGELVVRP